MIETTVNAENSRSRSLVAVTVRRIGSKISVGIACPITGQERNICYTAAAKKPNSLKVHVMFLYSTPQYLGVMI